jgi:hypothetical protein
MRSALIFASRARNCRWSRLLVAVAPPLIALLMSSNTFARYHLRNIQAPRQGESLARVSSNVGALLKSASPADRAWGAYLAQKNDLSDIVPDLIGVLRQETLSKADPMLMYALLDSLIQLQAEVPPDAITALGPDLVDYQILLMSRSPEANGEALLSLMRNGDGVRWRAVSNLLTSAKAPGFAAELLTELHVKVTINVVDPDQAGGGIGSGYGGYRGARLGISVPADFPPTGFFEITDEALAGNVVFAPGPHVVYYSRSVTQPGATGPRTGAIEGRLDKDSAVVEYLKVLTGASGIDLSPWETFDVTWEGPQKLIEAIKEIKGEMKSKYQQVSAQLMTDGLLFPDEALAASPTFQFELSDQRSDQSVPIPQVLYDEVSILPDRVP